MSKKKVLFITPSLCQGGIEHSMITMLNLLNKEKYDITLFTYLENLTLLPLVPKEVRFINDKQKPHYYRKPKAVFYNSVKSVTQKLKLNRINDKFSEKLRNYIHLQKVKHPSKDIFKNEKFDVVVSNAIGICTEMALEFNAKNYYVFFRCSIDMHHEMLEKTFPKYSGIIAVSDGVKQMLVKNYPDMQDKIQVIKNYVNAQQIINKSNDKVELVKNKLILCTCGRLSEEKGFDLAVESANILKNNGLDFIWYFVGDGAERRKTEELINKYNLNEYIKITGYVDNPFPYIKDCDIYIQPSYHESFGRTIKEAVILGKTVVSTDTAGGHTVLENEKYGEIVPVSSSDIAKGILTARNKAQQGLYMKYDLIQNEKEKSDFVSQLESILDK